VSLVPLQDGEPRPAPRPPPRLDTGERRRLAQALQAALADLEADAVLLAGSISDAVAALGAGLWTPALATDPRPRAPEPEPVAEQLGLTLHRTPDWHLAEGRSIAREEIQVANAARRERAARLAAASAAARRLGAQRVLAGAGAQPFLPASGLSPGEAERLVERYGLQLVTPMAEARVQREAARIDAGGTEARWRGRSWPGWALREAFTEALSAAIAWPMRSMTRTSPG
jgi:hypothetical protein